MKKKIIIYLLCFVLLSTLSIRAFAADSISIEDQIASIDTQITSLQAEIDTLQSQISDSGYTAIIAQVISTDPYIVQGMGVGPAMLNGTNYFLIDDPQDGKVDLGIYIGGHKFIRTTTINFNGVPTKVNEMGPMPSAYSIIINQINADQAKINDLQAQRDALAAKEPKNILPKYSTDSTSNIVLQIGDPYMYLYGALAPIDDKGSAPIVINGVTMVPLRSLLQSLGGTVTWDPNTQAITMLLDKNSITVTLGSTMAMVNGNSTSLQATPQLVNGVTMLPVRFVAENLGITVDWKPVDQIIILTYSGDWREHLDTYITATNDGNYTLNDQAVGAAITYPQSWGKPTYQNEKTLCYANFSVNLTYNFSVQYSVTNDVTPPIELNTFEQKYKGSDKVLPLTAANKGIQEICIGDLTQPQRNNTLYTDTYGETYYTFFNKAEVLCTNGNVICFIWGDGSHSSYGTKADLSAKWASFTALNDQVKAVLSSLSVSEAVG